MLSIKIKFNMFIVDHFSSYYINFGVSRRYSFFYRVQNIMHYGLQSQNIWGRFSIVKLLESVQNLSVACSFHYVCSSLEIMCIALIVLLLENTELFYILLLFCLDIEILAISSLFKCLIAIKCSGSRLETLQIFILI